MGKPPNLINGPYISPNIDHDKDMEENGAPVKAAKAIYVAVAVLIVVLLLLVGIGLHIPTGG